MGSSLENLSSQDLVLPVLVQLLAIVLVAVLAARVARRLKQPAAVGWIAAGILLGPSFLGKFFPVVSQWIFRLDTVGHAPAVSAQVLPHIFFTLAEIGLILLLFITGVEFNFGHLKEKGKAAWCISLAGIVAPFGLGLLIAPLVQEYTAPDVSPTAFALFLGTCMSITALPILGKLMMELNISRTRLAAITITAGATDDAVGWIALAGVVAFVRMQTDTTQWLMIMWAGLFLLLMLKVVRPLVAPFIQRHLDNNEGKLGRDALAYLLVYVMICGVITHLIGIFALFGAFLAGAILYDVPGFREALKEKLQDIVDTLFLPVFFTFTGLHTDINGFTSPVLWALGGLILVVAIVGKLGGCTIAARLSGMSTRESLCIGTMMNCRALMELIAINVGYKLGVIPATVYSMLVFMALITTVMTTPILLWLASGTELEKPIRQSAFGSPRSPQADRTGLKFIAEPAATK